jgi:hypothetical protein
VRILGWWSDWAYFLKNEAVNAVTVNGVRYRNMITELLWPQLDGMDVVNMSFQQDSATSHTACETTELLQEKFPGRVISRNGDQNWPPRSYDLTPCDFIFGGFVKSRVYTNKSQTIPELKAEIRRVIGETEPQLYGNVMESFVKRARVCQQSHGGHLSDIVFHN